MNAGDWSGMGVGARAMGTAVASRHEDHSLATQRDPLTIQWAIYIKEIYRRRICGGSRQNGAGGPWMISATTKVPWRETKDGGFWVLDDVQTPKHCRYIL